MEYISSDTNVWFDYYAISKLQLPFKLDCRYIMFHEALRNEVLDPPEMIDDLRNHGLVEIDLSTEEYYLAGELQSTYTKISIYDAIALSVAKNRSILLLTGDNALRKAAEKEGVACLGSIGLADRLLQEKRISEKEYLECMEGWKNQTVKGRRLPIEEIKKRINIVSKNEIVSTDV